MATPAVVVDSASGTNDLNKHDASAPKKRHGGATVAADGLVEALTYRDPFGGVYKRSDFCLCLFTSTNRSSLIVAASGYRYIFSADGKYLLGGMMVGDASDYVKLVALVKKKASLARAAAGRCNASRACLSESIGNINALVTSCRKCSRSRHRSSFSGPAQARIVATTLTTTRRSVAVT